MLLEFAEKAGGYSMVLNTALNASAEKSKKQLVYEYLKNQIITNELPPGTLLVERQLCTMLDASRTPIREAIQQLVSENLVTSIPTKGCFVSEVRYEDIAQLYDVREYLENWPANYVLRTFFRHSSRI